VTWQPFVSVLVPVRNEERYIERCLYSLAAQDYPRSHFEVIVVDGQSTDQTRQAVSRFAAESTLDLRLLPNPRLRTAPALNVGLRAARGEVITHVDGHATVAHDFIRRSVEALDQTGADCVGGVIRSEGDTPLGEAIALAMSSRFGVGGANFRIGGEGPADTVAFGAYRRSVFGRIGGFAEDIDRGEDDELNYRLLDAGGTIMLAPGIRATYTARGDLGGLWRQYFGYGRAKVEVLRRHPAQARPRQFVPAVFVAGLGVSAILALFGEKRALRYLVRVYTLAATTASLGLARQHGWRHLPVLPPIFACLHAAYGLGSLTGLLGLAGKFLTRTAPPPGARQSTEAPT
jgi:cellulose synthase/poly-beta-1,6-N-acetylglucosamine synthase-like glycosyltransferase